MAMPLPDCPDCGHNMSAYAGACSQIVENEDGSFGYCGHDCSPHVNGGKTLHESIVESFKEHYASQDQKH